MDLNVILNSLTPELYARLLMAVETGKWGDGQSLTREQHSHAQQAVMLYQSRHNESPKHMSISVDGQIVMESKSTLLKQFISPKEGLIPSVQLDSDLDSL